MYLSLESETEFSQLCPTLCYPVDCSLPGSSVHGILQVRVLEWVAISFSRGSSRPRDWTQVSGIAGRCFTIWATSEVHLSLVFSWKVGERNETRKPCSETLKIYDLFKMEIERQQSIMGIIDYYYLGLIYHPWWRQFCFLVLTTVQN